MRLNIDLSQGKVKNKVFFISDYHLFHNNVLKFDNRPFADVHEMHIAIEERWNSVVGKDDTVIYLGDLSFGKKNDNTFIEGLFWRLNGHIHFVLGNHDKFENIKSLPRIETVSDYLEVRVTEMGDVNGKEQRIETLFCCMHYPIYSWNKKHHDNSFLIHGHSHQNLVESENEWIMKINNFTKYIPEEFKTVFTSLINEKKFYDGRVVDASCSGWDYTPISHKTIIDNFKKNI